MRPQSSQSKKATQSTIRSHHQLSKQIAVAESRGDKASIAELNTRLREQGGLEAYQRASIQGQAKERGGDSSIVLMNWLSDFTSELAPGLKKMRLLEVGALSTENACSKSGLFDTERIDLRSQTQGILEQDFMERPLPQSNKESFDIISLSLVVNFVPNAAGRGEMLERTRQFLRKPSLDTASDGLPRIFPALFLVLPAACIANSRYMNEERFILLMASLGYTMLKRKQTAKLVYYLWQLLDQSKQDTQRFPKVEVNPGPGRNNFSIVLRG